MSKLIKQVPVNKLREIIFSVLGYDDFNLIRANKLYDRILFDYGYYANGVTSKRVKGCIFHYNHICNFGNSYTECYGEYTYLKGKNYCYRIQPKEINLIIKCLKEIENE